MRNSNLPAPLSALNFFRSSYEDKGRTLPVLQKSSKSRRKEDTEGSTVRSETCSLLSKGEGAGRGKRKVNLMADQKEMRSWDG